MDDDYSTIEHDFLHVKDYFSNYKFTYKERKSKLDFLLNIGNESIQDTTSLITSSKEQLVEVKNVYKQIDKEMKDLSIEVYEEEANLRQATERLEILLEEEKRLEQEHGHLYSIGEKLLINDKLNQEFDAMEHEINNLFVGIDHLKSQVDSSKIESKLAEEKKLRELRNDLAAKQKRLTIVNTDNYIEDIYCWYKQYQEILEIVVGVLDISIEEEKCCVQIKRSTDGNDYVVEVILRGKSLIDTSISKNVPEDKYKEFEQLKEYSMKINDARLLLLFLSVNLVNERT